VRYTGARLCYACGIMDSVVAFQTVEDDERRFPISPGIIVLALLILFIGVVVLGVALNRRAAGDTERIVTVAELRQDPDYWDGRLIRLEGSAESVRELPFLNQYAVYTFRDQTGTMLTLTQKGSPPGDGSTRVQVRAIYHSRVTLEGELRRIAEDQLGPFGAAIVSLLLPEIPINVVYLEHLSYAPVVVP
jgi:hypothetical protein